MVRDWHTIVVGSEDLVPGDLVRVEAGDKVPADLRLLQLAELHVDESTLTGESVPMVKDEVALPDVTPVVDRRNMLYSGTLVTSGQGRPSSWRRGRRPSWARSTAWWARPTHWQHR